jgi:hypothetical protein
MIHPLVYEINTRCWLRRLSEQQERAVTLDSIPGSEFDRWERLGFTHLWLMGVWSTGPLTPGAPELNPDGAVLGDSPYAITGYSIPESRGGEAGLQRFRRQLRDRGMKLILDFVPNHVGLNHPWLDERPELLVQSPVQRPGTFSHSTPSGLRWLAHGRDPYFPPWIDTAQLDYRLDTTRTAMTDTLQAVADRCDGVRCDMAMLVLNDVFETTWKTFPVDPAGPPSNPAAGGMPVRPGTEFWRDAIAATLRGHPDFLFVAEAYWGLEGRLQALGFDYTYNKEVYDELIRRNPAGVRQQLDGVSAQFLSGSVHFLENHDEARIASILSPAEHRAAALLILSLPGMRLLNDGQLEGARIQVPVQARRYAVEPAQPEIQHLYEQLLAALKNSAVGRGVPLLLNPREACPGNPTAANFVAIQWQSQPPGFDIAVVNLAPHQGQCLLFPGIKQAAQAAWLVRDALGTEERRCSGSDLAGKGLLLDLPGNGAQLLRFTAV